MASSKVNRRTFLERTAATGAALTMAGVATPFAAPAAAAEAQAKANSRRHHRLR